MLFLRTCRHFGRHKCFRKIVGDESAEYPILGPNTTSMSDFEEMKYVCKRPGTTLVDFEMNRACMLDDSDYDDLTLNQLGDVSRKNKQIALTKIASSMQDLRSYIRNYTAILRTCRHTFVFLFHRDRAGA